jgi:CheY-like chemotaxis protein
MAQTVALFLLASMPPRPVTGMLCTVALRALIVDDTPRFVEAARSLLERQGIIVAGVASTGAEALQRVAELRPDVALIDIDLGAESGFEVARLLAQAPGQGTTPAILISSHRVDDFADLIRASPALGFISKMDLSASAIHALLGGLAEGGPCLHEALVYSTVEEFLAATLPFVCEGLGADEPILVVTKATNLVPLQESLNADACRVAFADSSEWYRSPVAALASYERYVDEQLGRGAGRVRVVGEPVWPGTSARAIAEWTRYESVINVAFATTHVSFICPYDAGALPSRIVADARRTHPLLRDGPNTRPSPDYLDPELFVRDLGLE